MWTDAEKVLLKDLSKKLHARGWAEHVSVEWLVTSWSDLALTVNSYEVGIDDYTNDLTSRDALEEVVADCEDAALRTKLVEKLAAEDALFRDSTEEDGGAAVRPFYRFGGDAGWWWKRRPRSGPLRSYLDEAARRRSDGTGGR
jgi:hypothetical protein